MNRNLELTLSRASALRILATAERHSLRMIRTVEDNGQRIEADNAHHHAFRHCASCGATADLIVDEDLDVMAVVFCRECRTGISGMEFPEFYCDLGGGD